MLNLYRTLNKKEEKEFRQWARDNYKPGEPINEMWHPVVEDECKKMNLEYSDARAKLQNNK